MRSSVVLPQPEGPSRAISSPEAMSSDTSRSAWKVPNCLLTLRISMLMASVFRGSLLRAAGGRPSTPPSWPSARKRVRKSQAPAGRSGGSSAVAAMARSCRHSATLLITSVTSASSASSEATENAATDWYSL